MNTENVKTICKTIFNSILIITGSFIFIGLFTLGLWPIALLFLAVGLLVLLVYFIVYLTKLRGLKETTQEIEDLKKRIQKLERKAYIESLVEKKKEE